MSPHIITLENVHKSYGTVHVLNDISVSFHTDTTYAIIGKSGCGKSTILRSINGLIQPDSGQILIKGAPIDYDNLPLLRKSIGYAIQHVGLFPHLTIKENIGLLAKLRSWSAKEIDERITMLCGITHIDHDLLNRNPSDLSGGQQQRVGLARALMLDPEMLLLDEPFAALDPLTKIDIHEQFLELKSTLNKTIIIVTHDMDEALKLSDEILIMDAGRIKKHLITADIKKELKDTSPHQYLLEMLS